MHRGAFVTLASPHIKIDSLETILCDCWYVADPTTICISVLAASEVLCSQYLLYAVKRSNLLRSDILLAHLFHCLLVD
jgi:hypothetical protein